MDDAHAHELLARARRETETELARRRGGTVALDQDTVDDTEDRAEELTDRETDEALVELLTRRLDAIGRAEKRLAEGTYGRSVVTGESIPDARLEIEPWAERTVEEQTRR